MANKLENNAQQVFIDDDLIERLLGGRAPKPAKTELSKTEPAKTGLAKTELAKTERPQSEPAKVEPAKVELAQPEPANARPAFPLGETTIEPAAPLQIAPSQIVALETPELPKKASDSASPELAPVGQSERKSPLLESAAEPEREEVVPAISIDSVAGGDEHAPAELRELAESVSAEAAPRPEIEPAETAGARMASAETAIENRRMGPVDRRKKRPSLALSFAKAVSLASRGKLDEAIEELESAGGDDSEVLAGLGQLRFEQQNWAEAAEHFRTLAEAEPGHPTANYNWALCLERQAKYQEAESAFQAALAVTPKRWQAQLGRGLCLLRAGSIEDALASIEAAEAGAPEGRKAVHGTIVFAKAAALQKQGRLTEAAELYRSLLADHAQARDLLTNLMTTAAAHKNWEQAEDLAGKLRQEDPASAAALGVLAAAAAARGASPAAAGYGAELVEIAPQQYEAWLNLGLAHHDQGDLAAARQAYEEAVRVSSLQSDPAAANGAEANLNLGVVLQQAGDLAGANAAYKRALEARPGMVGAMWNLGLIAESAGDTAAAERLFARVASIRSDWDDVAFRLGVLQLQRADFTAASHSFEACLAQRAEWSAASVNLAICRWKLGQLDSVADVLAPVLAKEPEHPGAMLLLAAMSMERLLRRPEGGANENADADANQAVDTGTRTLVLELYQKLELMGVAPSELSFDAGVLLQSAGEYAAAKQCYQAALERKPEFAAAALNLGHLLQAMGHEQDARAVWARAITAEPQLAAGYFN